MTKIISILILSVNVLTSHSQEYEVYVCDAGNFNNPPWQILKYDMNGENAEVFISDNLSWPQDIVFLEEDNSVLISNLSSGRITLHNASNGDFIEDFANEIGGPTRMEIGTDNYLYVLQWNGNGKVLRYSLDGGFIDEFTDIGVVNSIGLDWDSDSNLYVSSYSGNFIRKFDENGVDAGVFVDSNLQGPTNIWFDENGDLLVLNWNGGSISRFDSEGNFIETYITGLNQPEGLDILQNGNVLIGDGGTATVKMYTNSGTFIEDLVNPESGGLIQPNAVVIREIDSNIIMEKEPKSQYLLNNTGSIFELSADNILKPITAMVYDHTGNVVSSHSIDSTVVWNAKGASDGYYILELKLEDNTVISERVLVLK